LDLLHAAQTAASHAAKLLRQMEVPSAAEWEAKSARDYVTDVDRRVEEAIAESLGGAVPGMALVGEELQPELARGGRSWVVDPLDGTTNFLHRFPPWSVSIAAIEEGRPVVGVVVDVERGHEYSALVGQGAWRDGQRLQVSTISEPAQALIGTGFPFKELSGLDDYLEGFRRVAAATAGIRRAGSAAMDLCWVASGRFDAFWEQQLAPWDVAAGTLMVREAGGLVTDPSGRDVGVEHGPLVAGNPAMHAWLLDVLRPGGD
jgi:myo-inositol-1(or 4)-monophosphatase